MDQNLKQRLTGAVILVSLAVIFIPVILEGPDNEWTPKNQGIPEPPQLDYKARTELPKTIETPALVKPARQAVEEPADKRAEPAGMEAVALAPEPVVIPPPVVAPEPAAVAPPPAVAPEPDEAPAAPQVEAVSGWYVQVGSFSQKLNASRLGKRLTLSGYDSHVLKKTTATGYAYRVLVGPGASREQVEKLRDGLAKDLKLKGIVINYQG